MAAANGCVRRRGPRSGGRSSPNPCRASRSRPTAQRVAGALQPLGGRPFDGLAPGAEYGEEGLGPLVDRLEHHPTPVAADLHFVALEAAVLRQADGLAAAVAEQLRACHDDSLYRQNRVSRRASRRATRSGTPWSNPPQCELPLPLP